MPKPSKGVTCLAGVGAAGGGLSDVPGGDPGGGLHPDPAGHLESCKTQEWGLCVIVMCDVSLNSCYQIIIFWRSGRFVLFLQSSSSFKVS